MHLRRDGLPLVSQNPSCGQHVLPSPQTGQDIGWGVVGTGAIVGAEDTGARVGEGVTGARVGAGLTGAAVVGVVGVHDKVLTPST